jgi:glutaredoxin
MTEKQAQIVFYGTTWCPDSRRSQRFLDSHRVSYQWIDIDKDPEASAYVQRVNRRGYRSVPTILFPDGSILVEPSDAELARKLGLET